ncbi:MAG: hypothetical protein MUC92_00660 [Fimbriimonadaceae bacterium]|jgi:predicted N-acetyltransferase YhbS|nr:hypothetical protein [Fimbriimonadaceae bacterium]
MIQLAPWHNVDFDQLEEVWKSFFPSRWHVSRDLLKFNTEDSPGFSREDSCLLMEGDEVKGFITVKESPGKLYQGPEIGWGYVTAVVAPDAASGSGALGEVVRGLRDKGKTLIRFGTDNHHFFPGCPEDMPDLREILLGAGFEGGEGNQYDVMRDLASYEIPTFVFDALARPDVSVRRCREEDVQGLEAHLEETFPGRWHYDVMRKVLVEEEMSDIFVLDVGGEIVGFAYTQSEATTKHPIGGCVWKHDLGTGWGGLGPIGVSNKVRGQKLGHAILGGALKGLSDAGVRRCIIDWTGLLDFYGAHGFEVYRVYQSFSVPEGR